MDFWEKLGNSFVKVGETAGVNWANTIGNSSPAMATTDPVESDTLSLGGVKLTATALALTLGGVLGGLVLFSLVRR